jgi:hypothetical protein
MPEFQGRFWVFQLVRSAFHLGLRVLLAVALLESTLYLGSWLSPQVANLLAEHPIARYPELDDAVLKYRPNPAHPEHDARGFRNPQVPKQATIVALGDSQTYGAGVEPSEAWPRRLGARAGVETYGMAYGGYGPTHGLVLAEEARGLRPEIVIQAFYSGNDLFDCFDMVYVREQLPELMSDDATLLQAAQQRERESPLQAEVDALFAATYRSRPRQWLASYSKTWAVARAFRRALSPAPDWDTWRERALRSKGEWLVVDDPLGRTILTPRYRLSALSLDDPRIRAGQQVAFHALAALASKHEDSRLLVVLIPTKELVFAEIAADSASTEFYASLLDFERRHWEETRAMLEEEGIAFVDTLPALRAALGRGAPIYHESSDGHPASEGHAVISEVVHSALAERGWL